MNRMTKLASNGWWLIALLCLGCGRADPTKTYGLHEGLTGRQSVSGMTVFRSMFQREGHTAVSLMALSDRAMKLDAIVWIPTDFHIPNSKAMNWFDDWLLSEDNRTLIVIGRDYSGASHYWETAAERADARDADDLWIEYGLAEVRHDTLRNAAPSRGYLRWFVYDNTQPRETIQRLNGPWAESVDATQIDLELRGRLLPVNHIDESVLRKDYAYVAPTRVYNPLSKRSSTKQSSLPIDTDSEAVSVDGPGEAEHRDIRSDILLADEHQHPLAFRIKRSDWGNSQILVFANASALENAQLVNAEHRKIASRAIAELAPHSRVGFMTTKGDIFVREPGDPSEGNRFTLLVVWPLNVVTMHVTFLGLLLLVALFPIFGRPRGLRRPSTTDFGQHVEALGDLLRRTRDRGFALQLIKQYFRAVRNEPANPWANIEIADATDQTNTSPPTLTSTANTTKDTSVNSSTEHQPIIKTDDQSTQESST